jgi:hypothetical protein
MEAVASWVKGYIHIFNRGFIGLLKLYLGFRIQLQLICGVLGA